MHRRIIISAAFLIASAAGALAFGGMAFAQGGFGDLRQNYSAQQAREAQQAGQVISAPQAIAIAQAQYPGAEYLDLYLSGGAMPVYTVILRTPDGRRAEVTIDARTGAVLGRR